MRLAIILAMLASPALAKVEPIKPDGGYLRQIGPAASTRNRTRCMSHRTILRFQRVFLTGAEGRIIAIGVARLTVVC